MSSIYLGTQCIHSSNCVCTHVVVPLIWLRFSHLICMCLMQAMCLVQAMCGWGCMILHLFTSGTHSFSAAAIGRARCGRHCFPSSSSSGVFNPVGLMVAWCSLITSAGHTHWWIVFLFACFTPSALAAHIGAFRIGPVHAGFCLHIAEGDALRLDVWIGQRAACCLKANHN